MSILDYDKLLAEHQKMAAGDAEPAAAAAGDCASDLDRARKYVAKVEGVPEGQRNDVLNRLAYHLRELFPGLSRHEHRQMCLDFNARCLPALPDREAEKTIESAWQGCHEKGQVGTKWTPPHQTNRQREAQKQGNQDSREAPVPLAEYDLPPFPTDALPTWLQLFVEAEGEATQTPSDLCGMLVLSVLATALAKKAKVKVNPGWMEPLNIYAAVSLPPGTRKSAVFRDVAAPLEVWERDEALRLGPAIAEGRERADILRKTLEETKRRAAKEDPARREGLMKESLELAQQIEGSYVPFAPRLIADDCTPERLATLLAHNGGRMAVLSAEGGIFEILAGRYSTNVMPNLEVFLKGHSGDTLRVDRVNRPPEFMPSPALTLGLCVQPDVIQSLRAKPGFRGRGFLGRILYALPKSSLGHRDTDPPAVPDSVRANYREHVLTLLRMRPNVYQEPSPEPGILTLHPGAKELVLNFAKRLEPLLAEGGKLGYMTDWAGKLTGTVVRIAGLLHLASHVAEEEPWEFPIETRTVESAIRIGDYLIPHAQAAYAEMNADPATEKARRILDWMRVERVQSFSKRDLQRGIRSLQAKDLDDPLNLLAAHGFIREKETERPRTGRPRSQCFEVNPQWDMDSGKR